MIFKHKHHQAQNWLAALALRENKKRPVQTVSSQTFLPREDLVKPQVVFTRYDLGHNESEAQKIRELYNELEGVPLLPLFALS